MTRPRSAPAPKGEIGGTCRPSRRPERGRAEWVRPYKRAQKALDSAVSLFFSTIHAIVKAGRCAEQHPIQTAKRLTAAVRELTVAALRVIDARRELAEAREALGRDPDHQNGEALELLEWADERCRKIAESIPMAVQEAVLAQVEILGSLSTGEFVPERRIVITITHLPPFFQAFLVSRQPRVSDRIAPVLQRRRRTPRPAEVRVPKRNLQGRAPPLSSICAL